MNYTKKGNDKLGTRIVIVNRPVGLSCPPSCPFLEKVCYALKTEKRFPAARAFAEENMSVSSDDLLEVLQFAHRNNKAIRIHERGDYAHNNGEVDLAYVDAWKEALTRFSEV